jgi:hypothetical protein
MVPAGVPALVDDVRSAGTPLPKPPTTLSFADGVMVPSWP